MGGILSWEAQVVSAANASPHKDKPDLISELGVMCKLSCLLVFPFLQRFFSMFSAFPPSPIFSF